MAMAPLSLARTAVLRAKCEAVLPLGLLDYSESSTSSGLSALLIAAKPASASAKW